MTIRPNLPSVEDLYINAAVMRLAAARNHLQAAIYLFDDAGYEHDPTSRAYAFVADIVSDFHERPRRPRPPPPEPTHIECAAKEYRRIGRRGY